jgi:hypothetical protein
VYVVFWRRELAENTSDAPRLPTKDSRFATRAAVSTSNPADTIEPNDEKSTHYTVGKYLYRSLSATPSQRLQVPQTHPLVNTFNNDVFPQAPSPLRQCQLSATQDGIMLPIARRRATRRAQRTARQSCATRAWTRLSRETTASFSDPLYLSLSLSFSVSLSLCVCTRPDRGVRNVGKSGRWKSAVLLAASSSQ